MTSVKIKRLHPEAKIPVYAHGPNEDAGMDLYAVESVGFWPGEPKLVSTGLSIELRPGFEGQIRPRSGLALKHGLTIPNSPGTIDPSYRGEIKVILMWNGFHPNEGKRYVVKPGDRIAQLVVARYEYVHFVEEELSETARGVGGFGSTGV